MTPAEFEQWFDYHAFAFPVRTWIAEKFPSADQMDGLMSHWQRSLEPVSLAACKQATDAMVDGSEEVPRGYSNHPRAVRKIAGRIDQGIRATPFVAGVKTVGCIACRDSGIRYVISASIVHQAMRAESYEDFVEPVPRGYRGTTVACTCDNGTPKTLTARLKTGAMSTPMMLFDGNSMIEMDSSWNLLEQWNAIQDKYKTQIDTAETWQP